MSLQVEQGLSAAAQLTCALIRVDTTNPPGNETALADVIATRLRHVGARVEHHALAPGRDNLVVHTPRSSDGPKLCLSGHMDVVPAGSAPWTHGALSGLVEGDRIWGRGAADMKGGLAAMIVAFERICREAPSLPVMLALTASEETGCQGAHVIAERLGSVGAMIIGEPTSERVVVAHKGVAWLRLKVSGVAAHGSRPELGVNAIDRMCEALRVLRTLDIDIPPHPLLGAQTINTGTISGGSATNIVPDWCEATVDIRLVPGLSPQDVTQLLRAALGPEIVIEPILALDAMATAFEDPWVQALVSRLAHPSDAPAAPSGASFFTDASVLGSALGNPPIVLVGPGDPALAHQVDEWCSISAIDRMTEFYEEMARAWPARSTQTEQKEYQNGKC